MTKLKTALANPALIAYGLWAKLNRRSLFNRYDRLSRLAGLDTNGVSPHVIGQGIEKKKNY